MAQYVSLKQAHDHLRLDFEWEVSPETTDDPRAPDLQLKLNSAEAIVLDYLKVPDDASPAWEPSPRLAAILPAAILLTLSALYDDRDGSGEGDYIADNGPVARLLRRFRDPALA